MDVFNIIKGFDNLYFYSRFVSGGESLKNLRHVSRKRLLLASGGISLIDIEANILFKQIQNFCISVRMLSSSSNISVDTLCAVNKLTLNNRLAGKIRNIQNWVGPSLEEAIYIPPRPDELPHLMENFIHLLNRAKNQNDVNIERIQEVYSDFIKIHPFVDGNGRCGRIIWMSLLEKINTIPPFIYRFNNENKSEHDSAVRMYGMEKSTFWDDMNKWKSHAEAESNDILKRFISIVLSKIPVFLASETMPRLLIYLLNQPIFIPDNAQKSAQIPLKNILSDICLLESIGLITKKGVRSENKTVYIFEPFYEMQILLEESILK